MSWAAALAALTLAGCGGTVIDDQEAEDYIRGTVKPPPGGRIEAVDCPDGIDAESGVKFKCTIEAAGGAEAVISLRVRDDRGTVEAQGIEPAD